MNVPKHERNRQRAIRHSAITLVALLAIGIGVCLSYWKPTVSIVRPRIVSEGNPAPQSLNELLGLSPSQINHCDIALMNLLCATDLRGAESLNVSTSLARLEGMARHVEAETKRNFHRFLYDRSTFNHSEAYFRCMALVTVLQQDFHVRYNPDRVTAVGVFEANNSFYTDAADTFLHGLVSERGAGTCASLPVLYVAVGRSLGYPLKLVATKNHLFVRWDDSHERFNFDATGEGLSLFSDDHYRQWPFPVSPEEEKENGYLTSMTPTEELAAFMSIRGHCLMAAGRASEAIDAHATAARLAPHCAAYRKILAIAKREAAQTNSSLTVASLPENSSDKIRKQLNFDGALSDIEAAASRAQMLSRRYHQE